MKRKFTRLLGLALSLAMVFCLVSVTASAAGKPTITKQPSDVTAAVGATASFTVKADGATSYLWQTKTSADGKWFATTFDTSKTATLKVPVIARRDGFQYRCKVTNSAGSVYTDAVTLTVGTLPVITTQPEHTSVKVGKTASFSVVAEDAAGYLWQTRTSDDGKWINTTFDTSKTATLKVPATARRNGFQYRCKITNAAGSVYTDTVKLTVLQPPVITAQPQSATAYVDDVAQFSVAAKGATGYLWQTKTSADGNWINTTFATSKKATLKVPAIARRNGFQYRCKITNAIGTVYTDTVTLTVKPVETLEWVVLPRSVYYETGETINVTAEVKGGKAPYSFEWRHSYYIDGVTTDVASTTVSSDGIGVYTKVCEEKDFGSTVYLVVRDSSGQVLDYGIAGAAPIGRYKEISVESVNTSNIAITYDNLPTSDTGAYRYEIPLKTWGSFNLLYEWQYVPASKSKSSITEDDWQLLPGETRRMFVSSEMFCGTKSNTLYIVKNAGIKTFLGDDGVWFRLKVTDLERNVSIIAREGKMYLK